MEELKDREQPDEELSNVQEGIVENVEMGTTSDDSLSGSLGKFKDAESLLSAYNNLQAEFTRKCQKLSEMGKELESLQENGAEQKAEQNPIYQNDNWKENVSAFLMQNSEAKEYAGAICNEILQDKNLQTSPNALELAWARVMKKEYASPKKLALDDEFINTQILSREEVKNRILKDYFMSMQSTKNPPIITSSGRVAGMTQKTPTTLLEAKAMVEKLFNLKG